jgi:hypothetical protein
MKDHIGLRYSALRSRNDVKDISALLADVDNDEVVGIWVFNEVSRSTRRRSRSPRWNAIIGPGCS